MDVDVGRFVRRTLPFCDTSSPRPCRACTVGTPNAGDWRVLCTHAAFTARGTYRCRHTRLYPRAAFRTARYGTRFLAYTLALHATAFHAFAGYPRHYLPSTPAATYRYLAAALCPLLSMPYLTARPPSSGTLRWLPCGPYLCPMNVGGFYHYLPHLPYNDPPGLWTDQCGSYYAGWFVLNRIPMPVSCDFQFPLPVLPLCAAPPP